MSDPTQTAPAAADASSRIDGLERKVDAIIDRLGQLVGGAHKDATATTQARLDEPGSVAEEVRRELARAKQEEIANESEAERKARLEALEDKVVKLTEKTPEPPPRRVEKIMGWHR
jgi:uncharacterized protein YceH (UPF0502 family)